MYREKNHAEFRCGEYVILTSRDNAFNIAFPSLNLISTPPFIISNLFSYARIWMGEGSA